MRDIACVYAYIRNHHLGLVAIFIALSGVAYATTIAPPNSVNSNSIINGQVRSSDLAQGAGKVYFGRIATTLRGQVILHVPGFGDLLTKKCGGGEEEEVKFRNTSGGPLDAYMIGSGPLVQRSIANGESLDQPVSTLKAVNTWIAGRGTNDRGRLMTMTNSQIATPASCRFQAQAITQRR